MKRAAFLITLGAICLLVGFSSYRHSRDRALAESHSNRSMADRPAQAAGSRVEPLASRPPAELASLKEKLKHSYRACPAAQEDWILRGQTAVVLATLTTAELKELLDEIVARPGNSLVKRSDDPYVTLAWDVLREWGRRDPVAACSVIEMTQGAFLATGRMVAFRDWLLRDPTAVARWMNSGEVVPADLRKAWLSQRVKIDSEDAIRQLARLAPEDREASLMEWSTAFALMPGERMALIETVREEPALLRQCVFRMAAVMGDHSVEEAYAFVDSLKLDEEMVVLLDDGIFANWATREPKVAFAAWAAQKESRVPNSFLGALDMWCLNSPGVEEAIQWLDTVQVGPAKEQIQVHLIENLTDGGRFEQAFRMTMSMGNWEEGKRQMRRVAEAWKERLPEDARERIMAILQERGAKGR